MYSKGTDPFGASIRRRIAELGEGFVGREWLAQMVVNELNGASAAGEVVGDVVGDVDAEETKINSSAMSLVKEGIAANELNGNATAADNKKGFQNSTCSSFFYCSTNY